LSEYIDESLYEEVATRITTQAIERSTMLSKKLFFLVAFGVMSVLLVSCETIPGAVGLVKLAQIPTSIPTAEIVQGLATVEDIEIKTLESQPIRIDVVSRGYLPDSCTYIQTTNQGKEGQFISISIITGRPSNIECAQQKQPFELHTNLDGTNLIPGEYTIAVNGVVRTFVIPLEQATPVPNARLSGIVWHDLCAVAGGEDGVPLYPSEGCTPVEKSFRANGFMETGEPGLEGVAVRLGLGDCPTNGYLTTTTSQNGEYAFHELQPGMYCVSIEPLDSQNTNILVPGEWSSPAQAIGQSVASVSIILTPGENKHGVDFGWDFQFLPVTQQAPKPTPTSTPTPTAVVEFCDKVKFVADLTVPDYTPYSPGSTFAKTWRVQNNGTCTWTSDYDLVFVSGNAMTDKLSYALPKDVKPGETIDLTVKMTAPVSSGNYKSNWMLQNPNGKLFGLGKSADQAFWALIKVVLPNNKYAYDFAANYCRASWSSDTGNLNCPGRTSSSQGFVILFDNPTLENRNENEPALWLRPNHNNEGWISGKYPPITIKEGDHFKAWVGCLADSKGCDVTFTLGYVTDDGQKNSLGQWHEIYDGEVTKIDLDLSFLSRKSVTFTLSAEVNNKKFETANAFWFVPRIENKGTEEDLTREMAIKAARRVVSAGIGISPDDLKVVQVFGPLIWNDSCLEVELVDVTCNQVKIPGYQILFRYDGKIYEAHTNIDGTIVYWSF
jgi:hypothetical protein